uniref:Uncharacterized protein n=1 Tax=Glossina pallidipes TaxID=7398 RepID=A0A1B0A4L4_GLOPL
MRSDIYMKRSLKPKIKKLFKVSFANIAKDREKRSQDLVDKGVNATVKSFSTLSKEVQTINEKTVDSKKTHVQLKITDVLDEETKENLIEMLITDIETAPTTTAVIITSPK